MNFSLVAGLIVGLALIAIVLWTLQTLTNGKWLQNRVSDGTWLMRERYALLVCLAPTIVGVASWLNPQSLEAVLLVRHQSLFIDILNIALISYFTVCVGISLRQTILLHGEVRFGRLSAASNHSTKPTLPSKLKWTNRKYLVWWLLGSVLPLLVCIKSIKNEMVDDATRFDTVAQLVGGFLVGWALSNGTAVLLAVFEVWALSGVDHIARLGILPYEQFAWDWIPAEWLSKRSRFRAGFEWLFRHDTGLPALLRGLGYTNDQGQLLPGHPQIAILTMFCASVYLAGYFLSLQTDASQDATFPTAYYGVLLLFLIGYFMTIIAFWLDRYGLPPSVFVLIYTFSVYFLNASDHFFKIKCQPASFSQCELVESIDTSNSLVYAAQTSKPQNRNSKDYYEQPFLTDVLCGWPFPEYDKKKTLVVVTASGGGIQAAAWTTKVLTELDQQFEGFSQSIGLISSVSGGSVGTLFYISKRGILEQGKIKKHLLSDAQITAINAASTDSALEAVAWGLVGPDFVRTVLPLAADPWVDRGWALESRWWNAMGRDREDRNGMSNVTIRDLIPLVRDHKIPPVIFNSTCVETGQRVQISPIHVAVAPLAKSSESCPNDHEEPLESIRPEQVADPIDFLDYYQAAFKSEESGLTTGWGDSNILVSTAVRLSATFSYVTPVARPYPDEEFGIVPLMCRLARWGRQEYIEWTTNSFSNRESLQQRFYRHFCDGGYADNPGLVTAVNSVRDLIEHYRQSGGHAPFNHVLIVRIEPFPATAAQHGRDNTGYESAVFGPSAALNATRVSSQAERGELELKLLEGPQYRDRWQLNSASIALDLLAELRQRMPADHSDSETLNQVQEETLGLFQLLKGDEGVRDLHNPAQLAANIAKLNRNEIRQFYNKDLRCFVQNAFKDLQKLAQTGELKRSEQKLIPIDSITFRFEIRKSDRNPTEEINCPDDCDDHCCKSCLPCEEKATNQKSEELGPVIEPPLTWTLSEQEKKDIQQGWSRIVKRTQRLKYYSASSDTISPNDLSRFFRMNPNRPWPDSDKTISQQTAK